MVLYGTGDKQIQMTYQSGNGNEFKFSRAFEGVITNLERRYRETNSEYIREKISEFMSDRPCPSCKGKRLNPAALAVTVDNVNIVEANSWPVLQTLDWVKKLANKNSPLTSKQRAIAERVIKEIHERLTFLVNVGLDYLTLNRSAVTLSGGEAQRIRLATQVGSRLVNACCMCWTSLRSDCTRAITQDCLKRSRVYATWATPFWSSSMMTKRFEKRIG
ncbi:MAG: hypothetical protein U0X93_10775 [Anaerolineales bacterium]